MSAALIGAGVGLGVGVLQTFLNREQQVKQTKQFWKASKLKFTATQNSVNIMKEAVRSSAIDSIAEVQRAGGALERDTEVEVQRARSKSIVQSEGITSGITKGKQAVALEIEANKQLDKVEGAERSQINQIVDAQDKAQNDLNNQLFNAHNELKAALAVKTPSMSTLNLLTAGISGAATGASLGTSLSA